MHLPAGVRRSPRTRPGRTSGPRRRRTRRGRRRPGRLSVGEHRPRIEGRSRERPPAAGRTSASPRATGRRRVGQAQRRVHGCPHQPDRGQDAAVGRARAQRGARTIGGAARRSVKRTAQVGDRCGRAGPSNSSPSASAAPAWSPARIAPGQRAQVDADRRRDSRAGGRLQGAGDLGSPVADVRRRCRWASTDWPTPR